MAVASNQYATGATRERIEGALRDAGKEPAELAAADLAMLEDFHTLGRLATAGLAELAAIGAGDRVLDAGGGIGGSARFLADTRGCRVASIDLTPEYCDVARWLNAAVGLDSLVDVCQGDVLDLPFDDASFDVVISQHVQMNITDKPRMYREARRVLAPGGRLAIWDVTAGPNQPIRFPVPWADEAASSALVTPEQLRHVLAGAGFEDVAWNDLTEPAAQMLRTFLGAPREPLGLHVFVPGFATKAETLLDNLEHDRCRLIQAVLRAPAMPARETRA